MRLLLKFRLLLRVGVALVVVVVGVLAVDGSVSAKGAAVGPYARECFGVAGSPGDVALVNLTPVLATGGGDGQLVSSDVSDPPVAANVNYGIGTVDPNVAAAPIGADGRVCFVNSKHASVHLIADHLASVKGSAVTLSRPSGAPLRKLDTRQNGGQRVGPSGRRCFGVAGSPGDVALVNVTPVKATGGGDGQLVSSDVKNVPVAANVNFGPGTVDPNVAAVPIGADGRVCFVNSKHAAVHVIADHLATIKSSAVTLATNSGAPLRKLDTRQNGGQRVGPSGRRCFGVAGSPGDVALVNVTPVLASGAGDGQLVSSDVKNVPVAANVNFGPGTVDPNVAAAPIGADGRVCFVNSKHAAVHVIADHLATIKVSAVKLATNSGAPLRKVDTRRKPTRELRSLSGVPGLIVSGIRYDGTSVWVSGRPNDDNLGRKYLARVDTARRAYSYAYTASSGPEPHLAGDGNGAVLTTVFSPEIPGTKRLPFVDNFKVLGSVGKVVETESFFVDVDGGSSAAVFRKNGDPVRELGTWEDVFGPIGDDVFMYDDGDLGGFAYKVPRLSRINAGTGEVKATVTLAPDIMSLYNDFALSGPTIAHVSNEDSRLFVVVRSIDNLAVLKKIPIEINVPFDGRYKIERGRGAYWVSIADLVVRIGDDGSSWTVRAVRSGDYNISRAADMRWSNGALWFVNDDFDDLQYVVDT